MQFISPPIAPRRARIHGFTIIELLVVISIISLLVSILLPALGAARTAAQMSASLSNLRQLQIALHSYASDNRESLIHNHFGTNVTRGFWAGKLVGNGYVTDRFMFWSPFRDSAGLFNYGSPLDSREVFRTKDPMLTQNFERSGYGVNQFLMPSELNMDPTYMGTNPLRYPFRLSSTIKPRTSSTITNSGFYIPRPTPSHAVTMAEFVRRSHVGSAAGVEFFGYWYGPKGGGSNAVDLFTVNGQAARGYLDGHATAGDSKAIGWTALSAANGFWWHDSSNMERAAPWFSPY